MLTALWTREPEKHSEWAAVFNEIARCIWDRLSDTNYTHSQSPLLFFFRGNRTNVYQALHLIFI